jgi:hypothetical protein
MYGAGVVIPLGPTRVRRAFLSIAGLKGQRDPGVSLGEVCPAAWTLPAH